MYQQVQWTGRIPKAVICTNHIKTESPRLKGLADYIAQYLWTVIDPENMDSLSSKTMNSASQLNGGWSLNVNTCPDKSPSSLALKLLLDDQVRARTRKKASSKSWLGQINQDAKETSFLPPSRSCDVTNPLAHLMVSLPPPPYVHNTTTPPPPPHPSHSHANKLTLDLSSS
ncbi:hypothetical protein ACTXT7_014389 [Hymenolepis weldensis]